MAKDEPQTRWDELFTMLKDRFEFVGVYTNPSGPDDTNKPRLVRVAEAKPEPGMRTPYVVFSCGKEILECLPEDFRAIVEKGVAKAKDVLQADAVKERSKQGTIQLDKGLAFEANT
jgi:hypothetical protein